MNGLAARRPQSVRFTVVAWTLTSTSPSPGAGLDTSATRTTSGGPYRVRTAAFIGRRRSGRRSAGPAPGGWPGPRPGGCRRSGRPAGRPGPGRGGTGGTRGAGRRAPGEDSPPARGGPGGRRSRARVDPRESGDGGCDGSSGSKRRSRRPPPMLRVWRSAQIPSRTGEPSAPAPAHPPDRRAPSRGPAPAGLGTAPPRRSRPGARATGPAGLGAPGGPGRHGGRLPRRLPLPGGAVLVGDGRVLGLLLVGGLASLPQDPAAADPAAGRHGRGLGAGPVRRLLRRGAGTAADAAGPADPERGRPDPVDRPGGAGRAGDRVRHLAERGGPVAGGGGCPPDPALRAGGGPRGRPPRAVPPVRGPVREPGPAPGRAGLRDRLGEAAPGHGEPRAGHGLPRPVVAADVPLDPRGQFLNASGE